MTPSSLIARARLIRTGGLTLGRLASRAAAVYGDRVAHVLAEPTPYGLAGEVTYRQVESFVGRGAAVLRRDLGVRVGERVVVVTENRIDSFWWVMAVAAAGATAVPVNPASGAEDLAWACEDSGAVCVITDPSLFRNHIRRKAALPGVRVFAFADASKHRSGFVSLPRLLAGRGPMGPVGDDPSRPAVILYTSGTTGRAKGVLLSHAALLSGLGWAGFVPPWPRHRVVEALPIAHVMGLSVSLTGFVAGVPVLHLPRFRAAEVLDALEEGGTVYVGVPTTYRRLEEAGASSRDLTGVRLWISAADVMPPDLMARFQSYGRAQAPLPLPAFFLEGYGMVESAGAAMLRLNLPGRKPEDAGFVGAPIPGWRARVVDGEGRVVGARTTGELELRGPGVLSEYLGDRSATDQAVRSDGWLRTGDLAWKDRLGLVHFAGRTKEVIKCGGYSVFPAEVEASLRNHPQVSDVVVFGSPDADRGEVPVAAIVPTGAGFDEDALRVWALERMAAYKAPRVYWEVEREEIPEGPTRKFLRGDLARKFEISRTSQD